MLFRSQTLKIHIQISKLIKSCHSDPKLPCHLQDLTWHATRMMMWQHHKSYTNWQVGPSFLFFPSSRFSVSLLFPLSLGVTWTAQRPQARRQRRGSRVDRRRAIAWAVTFPPKPRTPRPPSRRPDAPRQLCSVGSSDGAPLLRTPSPLVRRNKIENWRRQSEKKKKRKGQKEKKREFFLMWVPFVSQSRGIDNTTSASMWHTTSAPCRMPERRWLCWTGMTHFGKF